MKRLTQRQVANTLEWSLSKVNRIEQGEVTVSTTDLRALLGLYGITERERAHELEEDARAARRRGWWDQAEYRGRLTPATVEYLQFEVDAKAIRSFQPNVVPGALQTPDYASAVFEAWVGPPNIERDLSFEIRMQRRSQLLERANAPEYHLILDEAVLLRELGGPRTLSDQLYDLLKRIRHNAVTVRVVPLARPAVFLVSMFEIFADESGDFALYRESSWGDEIVYARTTMDQHRRIFEQIWERSLDPDTSAHMIDARAAAMRSAAELAGSG